MFSSINFGWCLPDTTTMPAISTVRMRTLQTRYYGPGRHTHKNPRVQTPDELWYISISHPAVNFVQQFSIRADQRNADRRHSESVRRATQARIVGADHRRHAIQHAFLEVRAFHEMLAHLPDALSNGHVVMAGGHDQVRPDDRAILIHLVVVDQRSPRRLDDADAFQRIH